MKINMKQAGNNITQTTRLIILLVYIIILFAINWFAFGQWLPLASNKGFWFYTGILSLLLGTHLATPYFSKPADAIAYAVSAGIAVLLVNDWQNWNLANKAFFLTAAIYCLVVAIIAFMAIILKDAKSSQLQKIAKMCTVASDSFGNPRWVFSIVLFFAIVAFHKDSIHEVLYIGLAWAIIVALRPLESLAEFMQRASGLWAKELASDIIVGEIAAYQMPGIVLIRQAAQRNVPLATPMIINDPHVPAHLALGLDYVGRDEGLLLRAVEVTCGLDIRNIAKSLPENTATLLTSEACLEKSIKDCLEAHANIAGIVAPETSIQRLYFEVIRNTDVEEGRLVEVTVGKNRVLYQIIDGLTKEEIIHQKNTYGYARAQAQRIGIWDGKKFKSSGWIPQLNSPVFLKTTKEFTPAADVVGHFPASDYTVSIKNVHELVTHNTAILGILGVGKSMLAIELVERMIAEKIKVVCLDLTNQYAKELSSFYDSVAEQNCLLKIQQAGEKDQDQCNDNPREGGSLPNLTQAIKEDLTNFVNPANTIHLKIYNPAKLVATKQVKEPANVKVGPGKDDWERKAVLWTATPVEITRIISEIVLELAQELGMAEDGKAKICLVYEEAHYLVPEVGSLVGDSDKAATNGSARAILQGRKYGMGCLLITQRTANVTKTILNQCNTIFAMRSFDETGQKFLADYIGKDYAEKLSLLQERQAVFFGKASSCENPVLIRLNDRDAFKEAFREKHPPPALNEQGVQGLE